MEFLAVAEKTLPSKRFMSRLNYLLEVGSCALTVLFPFATFFLSFFFSFEPNPSSETVRTRLPVFRIAYNE